MVGLSTKKLICLGLLVAGCVRGADEMSSDTRLAELTTNMFILDGNVKGTMERLNALESKLNPLLFNPGHLETDIGFKKNIQIIDWNRFIDRLLLCAFACKAFKPELATAYNGAVNSRAGNFVGTGCNKVGGLSTRVVTGIGSFFSRFIPTKAVDAGGKFINTHSQGLNIAGIVTGISFMGHAAYKNYNQPVEARHENWQDLSACTLSALSSSSNNNNNNSTNHYDAEHEDKPTTSLLKKDKELFGFQFKKTLLSKEFIAGSLLTTVSALNLSGHTDARNAALLLGGAALTTKVAVDCGPQAYSWVKAKLN